MSATVGVVAEKNQADPAPVRRRREPPPQPEVRSRAGRIIVVEDERDIAELIRYHLSKENYEVLVVASGAEALKHVRDRQPDAVLLDIMVPDMNGWEVCRCLKRDGDTKNIPVIMVTGRVEEGDKVLGLELGADDYVTKPFSPRELLARLRAVLRRSKTTGGGKHRRVVVGDLEVDSERFQVSVRGKPVDLTPKEFELLATLVEAPGRVFRRDELLDRVWGREGFVEPRTVDVHLARLRAKFLDAKLPPPEIDTVRGVGYRYREPAPQRARQRPSLD
jgi:DNA-binding response OmpR family regulator